MSNIVWVGLGNGFSLVIGFASSILLARWLGPEARGAYALLVTSSLVLASILGHNAWIQALAFLTGKGYYSPPLIAGNGILIALALTIIMAIPLVVLPQTTLASLFPEISRIHLWIILFLTSSTLLFGMLTGLLMGLNWVPLLTAVSTVKVVIALLFQIVLLGILNLGLLGALWELILSGFLVIGLSTVIFMRLSGVELKVWPQLIKDVSAYSAKSYPGHLGVVLMSRVDIYFVALFAGLEGAGYYAIAKGLTEIVVVIEQSITRGIVPNVITNDFASAGSIVARAFRVTFWSNALLLLAGALFAGQLIPLIYGPEFSGVTPAFLWLLPGTLLLTTRLLGIFFSMQIGRPEIPTYYILASGLLSLPVSYILTRQFGYLGAAAAFSILAILRGIVAISLFVAFSEVKVKDVLLIKRDDLLLSLQMIRSWLKSQTRREQQT
ncbi:MAG: hypothetical protein H3C69_09395 [Candidatus Promineofilum sp.]|nr:hypothetical protein [Promineifilum sp.]